MPHTNGPWVFDSLQKYPFQVFNSDPAPGRVEICCIGGNGFCPETNEENQANGRLIANAPDMHGSLTTLVETIDDGFDASDPEQVAELVNYINFQCRAVLAKC